jgi:hypothetical protein
MPKAVRDILTPETSRKVKGMSLSALSDYLWKLYAAGYSTGYLDGLAAAREEAMSEMDTKE